MHSLLMIPILLFSIILHEVAHGYIAYIKGDNTARLQGRLTLNPLPHIDLFGSILFPLLLIITKSSFLIGWAKPVPVNPFNLRNPARDHMYVSLAGITANFMLAVLCTVLLGFYHNIAHPSQGNPVSLMLQYGMQINVILAVFNLLPIPPLDGSWILYHLLPQDLARCYRKVFPYGFIILILLLITNAIQTIIVPLYRFIINALELLFYALVVV